MIYQLAAGEFERARPLSVGLEIRVAIHAIIEGRCPGRVFWDDSVAPTTAFARNEFPYSYGAKL